MKRLLHGLAMLLCVTLAIVVVGCDTSTPTRLTTAAPMPSPTASAAFDPTPGPDFTALARYMMDLVNRDRQAAGVEPLEWDEAAARAAQGHAEEMAVYGYLSHWDLMGYGPEYRYAMAGGSDSVRENVYSYYQRFSNGQGVPVEDWRGAVAQAQTTLMQSPGHHENILLASHTHVGIGIAYEPARGEIRIAQEFVDRYVILDSLPDEVNQGDAVEVSGRALPGASKPLINLAREPFRLPMTVEELNATPTYDSPATIYMALSPVVDGDRFSVTIRFTTSDAPGIYHVRVWVLQSGQQVLAANAILRLR